MTAVADRIRAFGRRRRIPLTIAGTLAATAALVALLAGRREEFVAALSGPAVWVLAVTALLQIVALLARSEAWHLTIEAAGGTVDRRVLYRASSMQVLGSLVNGHLGVAARITALRRSSPAVSPQVPTLIAAEFPILAVEAALAILASFTLVAPLGLPWWLPLIGIPVIALASAGLRHLALRKGRELWKGLAVIRSLRGGSQVVGLVLVAVFAQIFRNWMLLRAVGVDASFFDAIAVLIAVVTLGQLPVGPSVGAAAAVLILGSDGVAAAAAAGVLMTVTGTLGGLCFAAWAGADRLWSGSRWGALRRSRARERSVPVNAFDRLEAVVDDSTMQDRIEALVAEEHELQHRGEDGGLDPASHDRLRAVEIELDRVWDLLRQRRARRAAGLSPDDATIRDADTVEHYEQ
jgi:uncharacterized membrane protein YbhN (UPF0104 family)